MKPLIHSCFDRNNEEHHSAITGDDIRKFPLCPKCGKWKVNMRDVAAHIYENLLLEE